MALLDIGFTTLWGRFYDFTMFILVSFSRNQKELVNRYPGFFWLSTNNKWFIVSEYDACFCSKQKGIFSLRFLLLMIIMPKQNFKNKFRRKQIMLKVRKCVWFSYLLNWTVVLIIFCMIRKGKHNSS